MKSVLYDTPERASVRGTHYLKPVSQPSKFFLFDPPHFPRIDVVCVINPYILAQFLFGFFGVAFARGDPVFVGVSLCDVVFSFMVMIVSRSIGQLAHDSMPKILVDLYWSLTPQHHGSYYYIPDFSSIISWLSQVKANGWDEYYNSCPARPIGFGTFPACSNHAFALSPSKMSEILVALNYPCPYVSKFDIGGRDKQVYTHDHGASVLVLSHEKMRGDTTLWSFIGWENDLPCYMRADTFALIESSIKHHSLGLAHLRLSTRTPIARRMAEGSFKRHWSESVRASFSPSVFGHQCALSSVYYLLKPVHCKIVPFTSNYAYFRQEMESLFSAVDKLADWKASFSQTEIICLYIGLWYSAAKRYASSTYGVCYPQQCTYALQPALVTGYQQFSTVPFPASLLSIFSVQKPYSDECGTIIPAYFFSGSWPVSPIDTYSSNFFYPPSTSDSGSSSYFHFTGATLLISRYLAFLCYARIPEALKPYVPSGKSLLHVTLRYVKDGFVDVLSRTVLTPAEWKLLKENASALTYSVGEGEGEEHNGSRIWGLYENYVGIYQPYRESKPESFLVD